MTPRIDILTLFPEMFPAPLGASITGRAISSGLIEPVIHDLRQWGAGVHHKVDDRPFGGGPGMVMLCEVLSAAIDAVEALDSRKAKRILLSAGGEPLTQSRVDDLAATERILLLCGHYEGVDERLVEEYGFEEISIGDFVVSGGELPALLLVDAMARLQPGALGHEESAAQDSFSIRNADGQPELDCPHFTRPREWRGRIVPDVLLSGDHGAIARWRAEQSASRTRARRPDLLTRRSPQELSK